MRAIIGIATGLSLLLAVAGPVKAQSTATIAQDNFPAAWDTSHAGTPLNLAKYVMTFDDEFNTLDDACYYWKNAGAHKWYTLNNDASGVAVVKCPAVTPSSTKVSNGVLALTTSYANGTWQTGAIATIDPSSEGFQQKYGYFEARIMLPASIPAGLNVWPAFWVQGRYTMPGTAYNYVEVDILESWAQKRNGVNDVTIHQWPSKPASLTSLAVHRQASFLNKTSAFDGQWHTYGLKMTPTLWIAYVDGKETGRFPMVSSDMQKPIYPILDMALADTPTASHSASYSMYVDYVHVYACPASGCT